MEQSFLAKALFSAIPWWMNVIEKPGFNLFVLNVPMKPQLDGLSCPDSLKNPMINLTVSGLSSDIAVLGLNGTVLT